MQATKDSFYMALRSRLATLNSERVVFIDGVSQPAIVVTENEAVTCGEMLNDCFYVSFGSVGTVGGAGSSVPSLMSMAVAISYCTRGTADGSTDRGRSLAALDSELLNVCSSRSAAKCDYTKNPAVDLGTKVFWSALHLGDVKAEGAELSRTAQLTLYFYTEANAS